MIVKITGNGDCVHPHFHGLKIYSIKQIAIHNLTGTYYLDSSEQGSESIPITELYSEKEAWGTIIHSFVDSILDDSLTPLVPSRMCTMSYRSALRWKNP